ncbi:NTP transferase domain-containing protein [Pseudoalteromonas tunicata]|jgi:bifunctional N-acetylglucosamine-1-phosphate-uridyltransferase/glucosamine-1-phosphate-acetyltransferase GlmU-like protein|uniref:MobA-like NTP transferase domain-containing protein n=1 Tax=Pseudoalteromonas tunicata D2 TaxID=87626 RepID=A4C7G5_9GAMM|nr:NTP transferase domain-containing protein [Pseudoalteromonas tunicata]ATC95889.1 hypothetical protein PTUN_a3584 [Pseudoalteromonas tunicata]AXT31433.1 hypothetical protein D1819_11780 [Pseudoalteromonas tunicata]EAR29919.1 hypothetical protein PTD2_13904 [Pseudoalteromonas tunicata D2]MDP4984825.1 NTP transferase domain-containing protein [Pseudoalteromonas tunicata]MDP5214253.1 NTP transferase domain-containing protein [Pseudoalteromonas tunicata]
MQVQTQPLTLVILAAGLGSRFGGAKQLAEIEGLNRTIFELSILDAAPYVSKVVLVVNQTILPIIEQQILPRLPSHLQVELAIQAIEDVPEQFQHLAATRVKPWGTGHALLAAKPYVMGKAIVITADDYYGPHAFAQLAAHHQKSNDWAMLAYPILNTLSSQGGVNRGICQINQHGYLTSVTEYLNIAPYIGQLMGQNPAGEMEPLPDSALVSMTCWLVDEALFTLLEAGFSTFLLEADTVVKSEYYLPNQIQRAITEQLAAVTVIKAQDKWLGITYRDELAAITAELNHIFRDSVA